ncbi:MAG: magnesium-translocating P-type ATPase [Candidatus Omnitrophica bacterium]|nr:magnesium-translocating P-type ATPase [Candidatus Omnitrophota bacterium]
MLNHGAHDAGSEPFYSAEAQALLKQFNTSERGLTSSEAQERLAAYGYNEPAKKKKRTILRQILSKFINPLVIVLVIVGTFSYLFGEKISAFLVLLMILISVFLSFIQEYRSGKEAEKLSEMVRTTATVLRNGKRKEINIREIVPGDIVDLYAGDIIPADLRIISCKDLFLNQASLTGESFPVEKFSAPLRTHPSSLSDLSNIAFMGSSVVSGTALGLVVKTGISTQFGELSKRMASISTQTSFEKGIHQFVLLMIAVMLILIGLIFAINAVLKGNLLEAFMFSLAVAVGLTPEMLPMIVAVNLSKGAIAMSKKKVIVKRLNSIQNLGAMDVICTDKTGTLTLDRVVLEKHCDVVRNENEDVLRFAYINSFYQTGLKNLLDKTILKSHKLVVKEFKKVDEVPFDFSRRIMSVVVEQEGRHRLISKGAPEEIFKRCATYELDGEIYEMERLILLDLKEEFDKLNADGFRVLAVSYRDIPEKKASYSKEDETGMTLKGYLAFLDPPKPTVKKTIQRLRKLGIRFIVLTGDNELVTKKICGDVGLDVEGLMLGDQIEKLSQGELQQIVKTTTVFARLSPLQKEEIIRALRRNNHVVGYLGDGINDAPSLKASDVGISVSNAVDIAKESADIILLEKSLLVLEDGVLEGRKTFGNTIKYIKMGASSNFGNMISMTGASLFLPFLPMTPIQILLNNFLYDASQVAIPTDEVDNDYLEKPKPWDIRAIRKFMLVFGPISSVFDFMTFGLLLVAFRASQVMFHTFWFLESICTQTLVIHVIRTARIPFLESKPSRFLVLASLLIISISIAIPFSPLGPHFGFVRLSAKYFLALLGIVISYLWTTQMVKTWYVKRNGY